MLDDRFAAAVTVNLANAGHQQSQVVVNLRNRPNRAASIGDSVVLIEAECRRQTFNQLDVGLGKLFEKLSRVNREAFDVLTLAFGKYGVDRQRTFATAAGAGDDHQLVPRNLDRDVFQIVGSRFNDTNRIVHRGGGRVAG